MSKVNTEIDEKWSNEKQLETDGKKKYINIINQSSYLIEISLKTRRNKNFIDGHVKVGLDGVDIGGKNNTDLLYNDPQIVVIGERTGREILYDGKKPIITYKAKVLENGEYIYKLIEQDVRVSKEKPFIITDRIINDRLNIN